jgi:hypothetical protein
VFKWLHKFFYSDDEIIKLADGVSETEAELARELLVNNGVPAMIRNMDFLSVDGGRMAMPAANNFALYVKQSDVQSAIDILGPLLGQGKLSQEAAESRRELRRFRRRLRP